MQGVQRDGVGLEAGVRQGKTGLGGPGGHFGRQESVNGLRRRVWGTPALGL